jgi:protein involved in polysaccharide export with SLBB domain
MRRPIMIVLAGLVMLLAACGTKVPTNTLAQFDAEYQRVKSAGYHIHAGDVLDINFFYTPEYDAKDVTVRPDGKVSLPLVGDFPIAGMTPDQAAGELKKFYSSQLKDPNIAVMVKTFGANTVVVQGGVRNPGEYPLGGGATVLQIIGKGGSFVPEGDMAHVTVVRHSTGGVPLVVLLDLRKALKGQAPQMDVPLLPGDVIFVPVLNKPSTDTDMFGTTMPMAPPATPQP